VKAYKITERCKIDRTKCRASIAVVLGIIGVAIASTAIAQDKSTQQQRLLTDSEVKAKYQNCEGGWYSGPRPGKARYAKDPWLWVVTPDFARKYCMPPEFVSNELKGAEAVAFRLLSKGDEENCGFGGNPNACSGEIVLRFDIYLKSEVVLPRSHDGRYYQSSILQSAKLIGNTPRQWNFLRDQTLKKPESALKPHFIGQQVGLVGVKDGKVAWSIVALYEQTHFGGVFDGMDYYAFEGSTGFFENPGIKQNSVTRFSMLFDYLVSKKTKFHGHPISEFAYAIELPEAYTNQIAEADRTRGRNVAELARRAFAPAAAASKSTTP
jgi:hypothetical protein